MVDTVLTSPGIPPPPPPSPDAAYCLIYDRAFARRSPLEEKSPHKFYGPDGRILLWDSVDRESVDDPVHGIVAEKSHPVYAPQGQTPFSLCPILDQGSRVHDDFSSDFRLRGIDSPLSASSSPPSIEKESRLLNTPFEDGRACATGSNALGLYFEPEIDLDGIPSRNTLDFAVLEGCERLTRRTSAADDITSARFVSSEQLHGRCDSPVPSQSTIDAHPQTDTYFDYSDLGEAGAGHTACILCRVSASDGDILNINPILPDRFTAEIRNRMILGFKDGSIPDFDTFKSLLYAPIVLCAPVNADIEREDSSMNWLPSQQDDLLGWSSDAASISNDGDFELDGPEDVSLSAANDALDTQDGGANEDMALVSPLCLATESSPNELGDMSKENVVYHEDFELYGEDLLESRRRVSGASSSRPRNRKSKTSNHKASDRKITSFFAQVRQRKLKAALVRRLRRPPRMMALSGPIGSSLASARNYNPRIHRPEVLPTAPSRVSRVQGSGLYVGGERTPRALPLRVEDLYIGRPKCAPVLPATRPSYQCPICKQLLSHPVLLGCQHLACYVCIRVYLEHKWECPVCRVIVTENPVIAESRQQQIEADYGSWDATRLPARTKRFTETYHLRKPLYAVPRSLVQIYQLSRDLENNTIYPAKFTGLLFATDFYAGVEVPVMVHCRVDPRVMTIQDLHIYAWIVREPGIPFVRDPDPETCSRTVIARRGTVLEHSYTIFYTPQTVAEPKNKGVVTDSGKISYRGNLLVIKHRCDNQMPSNITQDEHSHITGLVQQ
ncbi:hypothetical protein R3P38DRAFT_3219476 [Favolaschia claudopus]|uniref:RING-type domain-containing protein n=1 Tax=Favolaschia claudopus TaxID=2862362 RepID=A0AAW0A1L8_9AGAR